MRRQALVDRTEGAGVDWGTVYTIRPIEGVVWLLPR
jgi:hypothetical protein